jgi:multicomponent Na+:H+ antiporter subunit E
MKNIFLMNILLTFVWAALTGNFTYGNFIFGFLLSYCIIWILTLGDDRVSYFKRFPRVVGFVIFFIKELIKANIQVAFDVVTPEHFMKPGIVQIPLSAKTELEITLLSNIITLTPGTLGLDVSSDKKYLYIHAMYVKDKEAFIYEIKNGFERRLLQIMR